MGAVTATSEIPGFADTGDPHNKIIIDTITGIPKTTVGDAAVVVDFLGDFGDLHQLDDSEWFTVDIDGYNLGKFQATESQLTSVPLSIAAADWANLIADGALAVTYTMGPGVDNINTDPNEFVRLSFSWEEEDKPLPPPSDPDPDPVVLTGTSGDDWLPGTRGEDIINGGGGDDAIFAGDGDDVVKGGTGDDVIGGGGGSDELRGGEGRDLVFGGGGNDSVYGGDGDDVAWGGAGNDLVKGANGNDLLGGGAGNDQVYGGAGNDIAYGGDGNDQIFGNMGQDALFGGAGRDTLNGGLGDDELSGGAGADTFVFGKDEGNDVIRDFKAEQDDHIDLGDQTYTVSENEDGFAVLELSGGGTITLNGIAVDDVNTDWFLMA